MKIENKTDLNSTESPQLRRLSRSLPLHLRELHPPFRHQQPWRNGIHSNFGRADDCQGFAKVNRGGFRYGVRQAAAAGLDSCDAGGGDEGAFAFFEMVFRGVEQEEVSFDVVEETSWSC